MSANRDVVLIQKATQIRGQSRGNAVVAGLSLRNL
jgi:hypothetical protein